MIEKIGGRKFSLAVLSLVLAFWLVNKGQIDPQKFLDFGTWIVGLFTAGNAAVDIAGMIKES
jgi:hypothetical protein